MNVIEQAHRAYGPPNSPTKSARSIEFQAFANIISRLKACSEDDFPALVAALQENRALWTLLAVDVADPGNEMPELLRAQIFYLAEFTSRQTTLVLQGKGKVDILIEINTAVMRGLAGHSPDAVPAEGDMIQ